MIHEGIKVMHPLLVLVIGEKQEIENREYTISELDREFLALYTPFD